MSARVTIKSKTVVTSAVLLTVGLLAGPAAADPDGESGGTIYDVEAEAEAGSMVRVDARTYAHVTDDGYFEEEGRRVDRRTSARVEVASKSSEYEGKDGIDVRCSSGDLTCDTLDLVADPSEESVEDFVENRPDPVETAEKVVDDPEGQVEALEDYVFEDLKGYVEDRKDDLDAITVLTDDNCELLDEAEEAICETGRDLGL